MAYDSSETILEQAKSWAKSAREAGWISSEIADNLSDDKLRTPAGLFKSSEARPLIVAFMGGTGVGKSTLLNRLAGKAVAVAGVERPTSKEVTLYHHQALVLQPLPAQLPLHKIKIAQHADLQYQNLIWIDMPDFDSTEQKNQHLVLEWLPLIDVLIYVVSPERYRDNKAWRLLLAEGARHAWVFVLNQWDKGYTEQYEDFKRQLQQADFSNPLVFKTDCTGAIKDEFEQLKQTLSTLATTHTVAQLENRAENIRHAGIRQILQTSAQKMGSEAAFDQLPEKWSEYWRQTGNVLQQAFAWPIKLQADALADAGSVTKQLNRSEPKLWDDWSQSRFNDALDELILYADNLEIPVAPIKQKLSDIRQKAPQIIATNTRLEVSQALANPGNNFQRNLLKFSLVCEVVLPISAMGWASYHLMQGYYQSGLTHTAYLGVDFAIHSILLILLAWLIPFFIRKKLKPSLQKAALRGLRKGLSKGLDQLDFAVLTAITEARQQRLNYLKEAEKLVLACQTQDAGKPELDTNDNTLARMLTVNQ